MIQADLIQVLIVGSYGLKTHLGRFPSGIREYQAEKYRNHSRLHTPMISYIKQIWNFSGSMVAPQAAFQFRKGIHKHSLHLASRIKILVGAKGILSLGDANVRLGSTPAVAEARRPCRLGSDHVSTTCSEKLM